MPKFVHFLMDTISKIDWLLVLAVVMAFVITVAVAVS